MPTTEKMLFDEFLKNTLTWAEYENLEKALQETPHMVTKYKRNPELMHPAMLAELSFLLKKHDEKFTTDYIINEFING